jgi:hypothetical protein
MLLVLLLVCSLAARVFCTRGPRVSCLPLLLRLFLRLASARVGAGCSEAGFSVYHPRRDALFLVQATPCLAFRCFCRLLEPVGDFFAFLARRAARSIPECTRVRTNIYNLRKSHRTDAVIVGFVQRPLGLPVAFPN